MGGIPKVKTATVQTIEPAFLDKRESAKYVGVSVRLIDRWRASGDLPYYTPSARKVLIRTVDLDKYLERFRVDVTETEGAA